jgi:hypothetical protein
MERARVELAILAALIFYARVQTPNKICVIFYILEKKKQKKGLDTNGLCTAQYALGLARREVAGEGPRFPKTASEIYRRGSTKTRR